MKNLTKALEIRDAEQQDVIAKLREEVFDFFLVVRIGVVWRLNFLVPIQFTHVNNCFQRA